MKVTKRFAAPPPGGGVFPYNIDGGARRIFESDP